jgi:hypothetical protein
MHERVVTAAQVGSLVIQGSWRTAEQAWSMSFASQAEEFAHRTDLEGVRMEVERTTVDFAETLGTIPRCLCAAYLEDH